MGQICPTDLVNGMILELVISQFQKGEGIISDVYAEGLTASLLLIISLSPTRWLTI
jgi:hypothetical protein